jgi:hypothetical protein
MPVKRIFVCSTRDRSASLRADVEAQGHQSVINVIDLVRCDEVWVDGTSARSDGMQYVINLAGACGIPTQVPGRIPWIKSSR